MILICIENKKLFKIRTLHGSQDKTHYPGSRYSTESRRSLKSELLIKLKEQVQSCKIGVSSGSKSLTLPAANNNRCERHLVAIVQELSLPAYV